MAAARGWLKGWMRVLAAGAAISTTELSAEWELVWGDEFEVDGAPDTTVWGYDLGGGGWGNGELQVYTNDLANARVEGGVLKIEVHQVEGLRSPGYTSARLVTRGKKTLRYGRVEVRAKLPSETGTWSAIWMLPEVNTYGIWPNSGEIDIMEHVGYEEDPLFLAKAGVEQLENVHATLHTQLRNHLANQGIGGKRALPTASMEFHTYALEWSEDRMEFSIDGEVFFMVNKATDVGIPVRNPPSELWPYWPFDQPFHLILNVAIGGNWGGHFRTDNYADSPYGASGVNHGGVWPQAMEVEYVRVYQRRAAQRTWYGFSLDERGVASTGDFLGDVFTAQAPFYYSTQLRNWFFMPTSGEAGEGPWPGWMWIFK